MDRYLLLQYLHSPHPWLGNAGRQTTPEFAAFSTSCASAVDVGSYAKKKFSGGSDRVAFLLDLYQQFTSP